MVPTELPLSPISSVIPFIQPYLDPIQLSDSNIHYISHGLIQSIDATTVKNQIIPKNAFSLKQASYLSLIFPEQL